MKSRLVRAAAAAVVATSLLVSQAAFARDHRPREGWDPIRKVTKIIKKIFNTAPDTDHITPPKP